MPIQLDKSETNDCVASLQRFLAEELDCAVGEMKAKFLLDYILKEIGPLVYNCGVQDAERLIRERVEELSSDCYEHGLNYWPERDKQPRQR